MWESSSFSSHPTAATKEAVRLVPEECYFQRAVAGLVRNLTTLAAIMDNSSSGCNNPTVQATNSRTTINTLIMSCQHLSQWASGTKISKSSTIMAVVVTLRTNIRWIRVITWRLETGLGLKKTIITLKCINKTKGLQAGHTPFSMKTWRLLQFRTITKEQLLSVAGFKETPKTLGLHLSNIHNLLAQLSNSSGQRGTQAPTTLRLLEAKSIVVLAATPVRSWRWPEVTWNYSRTGWAARRSLIMEGLWWMMAGTAADTEEDTIR